MLRLHKMNEFIPSPILLRFAELKSIVRQGEKSARKALQQAGHAPELIEVIFTIKSSPQGRTTPSQIADYLGLTPSTITNRINRMKNLGLIESLVAKDQRQTLLNLTPSGESVWLESAKIYDQAISSLLADKLL